MPPLKVSNRLWAISSDVSQLSLHSVLPKSGSSRHASLAVRQHRDISVTTHCARPASAESLPRVAQPSLWHSIVPKFLRRTQPRAASSAKSKEWNPATFYIVIFLLIGSQAIQIIALRNEITAYSRRADAKIGLLKEIIERKQRGEDVDVEGLLGTGDKAKEKEWEDGTSTEMSSQSCIPST